MDLERAARIARNRNQRQQDDFPLFAQQLEPITAEQVQDAFDKHAASFADCERRLQVRGDECRSQVANIISAQDLAALDVRRSKLPRSGEYHADFWRHRLDELRASAEASTPKPPQQTDLFGRPIQEPRPEPPKPRLQGRKPPRSRGVRSHRTLFDFPPVDEAPVEVVQEDPVASPSPVPDADAAPPPEFASGESAKAQDILAAIRTLRLIEQQGRPATTEEKRTLSRFAGFGPVALSIFPDPITGQYKDTSWQNLGSELEALLTPEEYESAKRTTFNAFYTSPTVIAAMHSAIERLGVPTSAVVLEPGCGTGNFMSLAPRDMRFIGVELDSLSGRIAKALHPHSDIRIESFRDTSIPEDSLDCVIGNVPFADLKLEHRGQKYSLHDYFFAKSVDLLRPGGILALVTSHFTLDKQNGVLREYLASKADFIGAIRLPSDAFKREGTAVVTDIVFLRKRAAGESVRHQEAEWHRSRPFEIDGVEVSINRYFVRHPDMVLGKWSRKNTLYGEGFSVQSSGDLAKQLEAAIERLPEFATFEPSLLHQTITQSARPPPLQSHVGEGSFFVDDAGAICQLVEGRSDPVVYGGKALHAGGTQTARRMAALIRLRDLARRVLQSQNEGWPETERDKARKELNWAYDRFSGAYGPINKTTVSQTADGTIIRRMPNLVKFREDPDAMLVMSLEHYDESTGKAAKAAIMQRDVVGKRADVTSVASAEEGLLVSLDRCGKVDLPFIAKLYGKPESAVVEELGDLVFRDPEQGEWQTADQYLSGNVRSKLKAVLSAGAEYARNAGKLSAVQPEDVLPGDIDCNLGAPWIPETDIRAFACDLFKVGEEGIDVGHLKSDAVWSIDAGCEAKQSVAAISEYGTERANGAWLLELALNMKAPTIYDTIDGGGREERVVNQELTLAAREKQRLIKERFRSWVFADPERTERLVRLYNDTYNNLRPRLFDGSHLDFPGMNQTIRLRSHQRNAIWRCMTAGNTLLAQDVGAGKTYIMAATGMKMRQAGLVKKPMYVVPNHLLEQFGREFLHLYPNARVLVAGKEDLARDRRKLLTAKIASGDWDGIVVTHSSFERIGMSRGYQEQFLRQQIAEYTQLLHDAAGKNSGSAKRNLRKTIEKQKAAREERLKDLLAENKKDDGLVFEELGVDHVFIDEAQYYKNLETPTKMERVAGIQTGGSERAFDVFMKAQFLHQRHPGHGVTFATGTPISNTMVEMYTMQRYLDPEGLRSRGIDHFDAWAATFGEVIDAMEIAPDGKSLRPRSRFAKFTNLPELQQMFRSFADVQTAEMLDLPRPHLENGKATVVACPMSAQQRAIQDDLVERYERLRSQKVDPRVDNALSITTDGRKLALDARMLDASAPDFPDSKVNRLVQCVADVWRRTASMRGAQMIFCDMGVHPTPWGYSAYGDIVSKLVAAGIPEDQVAVVGDADSDMKKQSLFEKVRSGQIRILLGSTQKMGTGTNVQKRLAALHHLDAPWKPAEVEQREGRILRQGNENAQVAIYRYVTEGSFDAYMWQALETKARFISQVMAGDNALRRAEDIGGQELSYAEVKAIASGNPAVLTLAEAEVQLQRLSILRRNHADEQFLARRSLRELPGTIENLRDRLARLEEDLATVEANAQAPVTIGARPVDLDRAVDVLGDFLEGRAQHVRSEQRIPLGVFQGLRFGIVLHPQFAPEAYLEGAMSRTTMMSREHHGPRAILNAVGRLAGDYASEIARVRQQLSIAEQRLRDYEARLGVPFHRETLLNQITTIRDRLKVLLSGTVHENGDGVSTEELTRQFKAIKEADCVDGMPERIERRRLEAEEPVTSRIRRRMETTLSARDPADRTG